MQFSSLLLIAIATLTLLTGIAVLFGINKEKRFEGFWYFVLAAGVAIWGIAIAAFLSLAPTDLNCAPGVIYALYVGAPIMLLGFVGYTSWRYKIGKALTILYIFGAIALAIALAINPHLLYTNISLSHTGNIVHLKLDWFYYAYIAYCILTAISMLGFTAYNIKKTKNRNERRGMQNLLIGTIIAACFISTFDLFLPLNRYDLIWVGPLVTGINVINFYYAILRYRLMPLNAFWLRALSYVVITVSATILYMVIFFLIFAGLFHSTSPSLPIIILNFVLVLIIMLLIPIFNELMAFIKSLISVKSVDLSYIFKKITFLKNSKYAVNLSDLAEFLESHLHFQYIGILVNGRIYSSQKVSTSTDVVSALQKLSNPKYGIWQSIPVSLKDILNKNDIKAVAELHDSKGKVIGQVILGRPQGKIPFENRDLAEIEIVLNLVANLLDRKKT